MENRSPATSRGATEPPDTVSPETAGSEAPASPARRAGRAAGPASGEAQSPAAVQSTLDLTLADSPPRPPSRHGSPATPPRESSGPPPAQATAPSQPPMPPQPSVAMEPADVPELTRAAIREITDAVGEATRAALGRITSHLRVQGAGIETRLEEAQGQARTVVRLMEELLDSSVEVSEATARTYRDTQQGVIRTLEEVIQRAEKQLGALVTKAEEQHRRLDEKTQALAAEAQRAGRRLGWRPWLMATTMAIAVLSLLTAVRPGWTMSAEQRRALRVGEAVIYTYSVAREPEKAEMRRVMRWRAPERPDSTEAPPVADLTR